MPRVQAYDWAADKPYDEDGFPATHKAAVNDALKDLRKQGFWAKQNHSCCSSCGWSEIPREKVNGPVLFYNRQSNGAWEKADNFGGYHAPPSGMLKHDLYFNWGGPADKDCKSCGGKGGITHTPGDPRYSPGGSQLDDIKFGTGQFEDCKDCEGHTPDWTGERIKAAFEKQGLTVKWDGTRDNSVAITPDPIKKPEKSPAQKIEEAGHPFLAATEHDKDEEEEDDDIKIHRFDHGPGQGNGLAHSEIHQQEHMAHFDDTGDGDPTHSAEFIPWSDVQDEKQHVEDRHDHDPGWDEEDDDTDWSDYHAECHGAWDTGENDHYHDRDDEGYAPHDKLSSLAHQQHVGGPTNTPCNQCGENAESTPGKCASCGADKSKPHEDFRMEMLASKVVDFGDYEMELLPDPTNDEERGEHLASRHELVGYKDEQTHGNAHYRATEDSLPDHIHQSQLDEFDDDYGVPYSIREARTAVTTANVLDKIYDKAVRLMGSDPCPDCHGRVNEQECMTCNDTGIDPFPNAGKGFVTKAQDGGGGGAGGGDGGGAAAGGDAGGGDASFSGGAGDSCSECGCNNATHVGASCSNHPYCPAFVGYGHPRYHKKKRKHRKEELERAAAFDHDLGIEYRSVDDPRGPTPEGLQPEDAEQIRVMANDPENYMKCRDCHGTRYVNHGMDGCGLCGGLGYHELTHGLTSKLASHYYAREVYKMHGDVRAHIRDEKELGLSSPHSSVWKSVTIQAQASDDDMSGQGCGRCGRPGHASDNCQEARTAEHTASKCTVPGCDEEFDDPEEREFHEEADHDEGEREQPWENQDSVPCGSCGREWTTKAKCSECGGPFCDDSHSCGSVGGGRNTACDNCWPSHGGHEESQCPECESSPPCESEQECDANKERMWAKEEEAYGLRMQGTFVAKPKKKPDFLKKKKKGDDEDDPDATAKGVKKVLDKADEFAKSEGGQAPPQKKGQAGTSEADLTDNVGSGEHPVPVTFITDHAGEVAQGVEPAMCISCGKPMDDHARWVPTHQRSAADEELTGWMDSFEGNRPKQFEE